MATKSKRKARRQYFARRAHHKTKMTIPLAVVAGFAGPVTRIVQSGMSGGIKEGANEASRILLGISPFESRVTWQPYLMRYGALPIVTGLLVHKAAGMLGINRMLARSGIPLIRI